MPLPEPTAPGAAAAPPAAADVPPELRPLLARYELLGELGRGGMAVVYRGRERAAGGAPGREVAIKVVSHRYAGDADAVRRFEREARTVAGLDHPNIVRTLAIEALADDAVAIVARYVPGETLRAALRAAGGPFDYPRAAAVLRDLAAALAYAHARRIVHRDVKPENVFLEAGTGRALLADFGIARPLDVDSPLTVDGSALGTPTYMAPEQIVGRPVDERTDVYALGLVGWELLAGRRPWQGETLYAVLHRQQHDQLPDLALLRPDIPAYLLAAVRGAVAKDPAGRWRDGADFLARLTPAPVALPELPAATADEPTFTSDYTLHVTPETTHDVLAPRGARRGRRGRAARRWAALAAAAAALGASGALIVRHRAEAARRADDAAVTGLTDAQLDSLLRAAAAAARPAASPPRRVPATGRPAPLPGPTSTRGEGAGATAAQRPVRAAVRPTGPAAEPATPAPAVAAPAALAAPAAVRAAIAARTGDARCTSTASGDQRACLMAAIDQADAPLNGEYQALIAELRRRAGGAREPPPVTALRVEQRAWLQARDRQCRAALAGREGRLWGAARAPCFAALSDRRTAELRGRRARYAGPSP